MAVITSPSRRRSTPRDRFVLSGIVLLVVLATIGTLSCDKKSPPQPSPVCIPELTPGSIAIEAAGGTGSLAVSIANGCAWQAQSTASWLTLTTASGNGSGTVVYQAESNPNETTRAATIAVGSRSVPVTQAGREATPCEYVVEPATAAFNKDGGTATATVTAPDGCAWTAVSHVEWIAIVSGASGSGTGTVTYSVSETREPPSRTGTLTVAGRTITVSQDGDAGACSFSVAPVDLNACLVSTVLTTTITTDPACTWTAQTNVPWMSAPASGTGSGQIRIVVEENYDAPRNGILMVRWDTPTAGQNVRVAQAGCRYAVSQTSFAASSLQTSFTFMVVQQSDPLECGGALQDRCRWSAVSDVPWIVVTSSMPRQGDDQVAFTVLANPGPARSGTIRVRDQVVRVDQAAVTLAR